MKVARPPPDGATAVPSPVLCSLIVLVLSSISVFTSALQGPDFDGADNSNHIYSSFFHEGPNSMGAGPQSTGSFLSGEIFFLISRYSVIIEKRIKKQRVILRYFDFLLIVILKPPCSQQLSCATLLQERLGHQS